MAPETIRDEPSLLGKPKGKRKPKDKPNRKVTTADGGSVTVVNKYGKDPETYTIVKGTGAVGDDGTVILIDGKKASPRDIKAGMFVMDIELCFDASKLQKITLATTLQKICTPVTQ